MENVFIKNGSLSGETHSAEQLRSMADANSAAGIIPSYLYTTEESEQTAQIHFDVRDASNFNGSETVAVTPAQYVEALTDSIDQTLNGAYFKDAFSQTGISCEFRPARTQATPQIRHQMKPATVVFDASKRFISAADAKGDGFLSDDAIQGKVEAGAEINLKAPAKGILFSASTKVYDFSAMGAGFTAGGLEATLHALIKDVTLSLCDGVVDALSNSEAVQNVQVSPIAIKGRRLPDIAQDIIDAMAIACRSTGFADNLTETALIVPTAVENVLIQLAQRNGFSGEDCVSLMLGTSVLSYRDTAGTGAIYLAPKSLLMLSWRSKKDGSGDIFDVITSRDAARQAWTVEVISCIDLVADAFCTVKYDSTTGTADDSDYFNTDNLGNGLLESYSQIKHIVRLTFDGVNEESLVIPGITFASLSVFGSDVTVTAGEELNISATISGGVAPYVSKWTLKGAAIPSGNTSSTGEVLTYAAADAAMAGEYEVTVTDAKGSTAKAALTVAITAKP